MLNFDREDLKSFYYLIFGKNFEKKCFACSPSSKQANNSSRFNIFNQLFFNKSIYHGVSILLNTDTLSSDKIFTPYSLYCIYARKIFNLHKDDRLYYLAFSRYQHFSKGATICAGSAVGKRRLAVFGAGDPGQ